MDRVYELVAAVLGWTGLIGLGVVAVVVVVGPLVGALLVVRTRRAHRQHRYPPCSETRSQLRWRKTREHERGDSAATEVVPRVGEGDRSS
jgi:hypothetical protein